MKPTVYGIPACGTCRKARAWLESREIDHDWVDLRESPPSRARIRRWMKAFGFRPMRNTSGGSYRALGPERDGWGDREWEEAFAADPMLLKRPVLEIDGAPVRVGFRTGDWEAALQG
jgi:arsenate reductase